MKPNVVQTQAAEQEHCLNKLPKAKIGRITHTHTRTNDDANQKLFKQRMSKDYKCPNLISHLKPAVSAERQKKH